MVPNGFRGKPADVNVVAMWATDYRNSYSNETHPHFFGSEILQLLLQQPGCTSKRVCYGLHSKMPQPVAAPANSVEIDELSSTFIVGDGKPTGAP